MFDEDTVWDWTDEGGVVEGVAHVKNIRTHPRKLVDRSRKMVFIGYEEGSKAYRVLDPVSERVHIT